MIKTFHKASIHLLIAGICSFLFGIITLTFQAIPLSSLIGIFAAYMVIKGFSLSAGAWRNRQDEIHWWFLLWYGVLNIITGIVVFIYPNTTLIILGFIVSINLLIGGVIQIIMAIHLRREVKEGGWLIFSGLITLVAGIYIYLIPRIGTVTIIYLIAIAAFILSVFLISLSLKAFGWRKHLHEFKSQK